MRFYSSMPDENFFVDKVFKWIVDVVVVIVLALFCITFFCEQMKVSGNSMSDTLQGESTVLIDKFNYRLSSPDRYDVIAFSKSEKNGNKTKYIKRVIGLPGETVLIRDNRIYVNGKELKYEKYDEAIVNAGVAGSEITLDYNEYFVLGDNVNSSEDSRSSAIGSIKKNEIIGKVWFTAWPFEKIKTVK